MKNSESKSMKTSQVKICLVGGKKFKKEVRKAEKELKQLNKILEKSVELKNQLF